jgi:hypothetical protein
VQRARLLHMRQVQLNRAAALWRAAESFKQTERTL